MKALGRNWKAILAALLVIAAVAVYFKSYSPAKTAYESEKASLNIQITALQNAIVENKKYESVQEELEPATEAVNASRTELYSKFPVELKEEDQLMYMLYLEEKFGKEVNFSFAEDETIRSSMQEKLGKEIVFSFAEPETILPLSDGSELQGATIAIDYETTYAGFKKMVKELATDSRITSVRYATFDYDAETDKLIGQMIITNYLLQDGRAYQEPSVQKPSVGKDNPFAK